MERTLEEDKKQQKGHFDFPKGAAFSVDKRKHQFREPAEQKSSAPGDVSYGVMREHVTVEEKQKGDPGERKE